MRQQRCVILSPHLDDAALSCGGLVASIRDKMSVEIWTIFTRGAWRGPYSPSALWLHGATCASNARQLYTTRREEDRKACRLLGARARHFRWMDAPYRKDRNGNFLYPGTLGLDLHPDDKRLIDAIAKVLKSDLGKDDSVLVPLSTTGHIDHTIVRMAVERAGTKSTVYYPDLPYAADRTHAGPSGNTMQQVSYRLTKAEKATWIAAVGCFATQIFLLQDASGSVQDMILNYAAGGLSLFVPDQAEILLAAKAGLLAALAVRKPGTPVKGSEKIESDVSDPARLDVQPGRAPIAVFAFRRLEPLQKTLHSLEKCEGFSGREMVVFSDAPRPGRPDEALAVAQVRAWLRGWCLVTGATLREAKCNRGLHVSITSGVTELLETYERVIVIEDDLVLSPAFLAYMNEALVTFESREDIVQVSGYMVPHNDRLPSTGLLRAPGSWGWGTWRLAWRHYRDDAIALLDEVRRKDTSAFDFDDTYGNLEALERNATGTLDTWAVRWYASVFLRSGLTVYPSQSLVRNIGFGDDGTNCKPGPMASVFSRQPIARVRAKIDAGGSGTGETREYAEATKKFYRWQQRQWTKAPFTERVRASLGRLTKRSG